MADGKDTNGAAFVGTVALAPGLALVATVPSNGGGG